MHIYPILVLFAYLTAFSQQAAGKCPLFDYISGPSARDYIEPEKFENAGIKLEYMTYEYLQYQQLYPPYEPKVSIVDLMFMTGPKSLSFFTEEINGD